VNFSSFLTCPQCSCSGQGNKVCLFTDSHFKQASHVHADRDALKSTLLCDKAVRLQGKTPTRDIFWKTSVLITALQKQSSTAPIYEETYQSVVEQVQYKEELAHQARLQWGYILSKFNCDEKPYIQCGCLPKLVELTGS
jgi:hypothetical protein